MVTFFLFSVHTITEAKQYAGLGGAEPGLEPGRWIFQPGHLIWRTNNLARPGVAPPPVTIQTSSIIFHVNSELSLYVLWNVVNSFCVSVKK